MKRRRLADGGRLSATGEKKESINPMDGIANLADVMLVLACGLMVALIVSWNVDIGRSETLVGVDEGTQMTEVDGVTQPDGTTGTPSEGNGYEEMGKVYRDPTTGKLYMVLEGEAS
jgi:hypothetical protein